MIYVMRRFILLPLFLLQVGALSAQCTIASNPPPSDDPYEVIVNSITYAGVILAQNGSTCNARVVLDYDIDITDGGPGWWNGNMYTLQGNLDCAGGDGTSFFGLPNGGGGGTVTSANFSFNNTSCSNVSIDCDIELQIGGPNLNYTGPCGSISAAIVPVDFADVRIIRQADVNVLYWTTASEINSDQYHILRSVTGENWETIGKVASSNSISGREYKFDLPHHPGITYYRVMSVDYDGSIDYSSILQARATDVASHLVYPNPASDQVFITDYKEDETITIYDMMGRPVLAQGIEGSIDVSSLLPGIYRYTIHRASSIVTSGSLVKQ